MSEALPVGGILIGPRFGFHVCHLFALVQVFAVVVHHVQGCFCIDQALFHQFIRVNLPRGFHAPDFPVHHRLRGRGFIRLVVPVPSVTDQVDHDITLEGCSEVAGDLHHVVYSLGVITVDMENRGMHHFRDRRAVQGRAHIVGSAGGEPHLVVDHDMKRSSYAETACLGHLEQLHDHPLNSKGGIAMNQDRHDFVVCQVFTTNLPGPDRTDHNGVDDFKMRRVKGQRHVHGSTAGLDI